MWKNETVKHAGFRSRLLTQASEFPKTASINRKDLGEEVARIPCRECLLWDFVPAEHRAQEIPCHFIPLNDLKETVYSLEQAGKREDAEQALLDWLNQTIGELEKRLAEEQKSLPSAPEVV